MKYVFKKKARRCFIQGYHTLGIDKFLMYAGYFDKRIDNAIDNLGSKSKLSRKELKSDIKRSYYKYLTNPEEYFLFGFEGKDHTYRSSFLCDNFRIRTLVSVTGEKKFVEELTDKYNFYRLTKKYFGREAFVIGKDEGSDLQKFVEFTNTHKTLFVKPLSASYGLGAHKLDIKADTDVNSLYFKYLNQGGGGLLRIE